VSERVFFSYARYALVEALRIAGVERDNVVLVPNLICRDVFSAIDAVGATTKNYPITHSLCIDPEFRFPAARAIIVVNYFGFPADLDAFEIAGLSRDTIIIEDNAHGWLSRDHQGRLLGERTTLGITSFRKTIRTPDGAYLSWSPDIRIDTQRVPAQPPCRESRIPTTYLARHWVDRFGRRTRLPLLQLARWATRFARVLGGKSAVNDDPRLEFELPAIREPHALSLQLFGAVDQGAEIERRRARFRRCVEIAEEHGVRPAQSDLGEAVSPQGFPFWGGTGNERAFTRAVRKAGLGDIVSWPALSARSEVPDESDLRSLKIVNFLQ